MLLMTGGLRRPHWDVWSGSSVREAALRWWDILNIHFCTRWCDQLVKYIGKRISQLDVSLFLFLRFKQVMHISLILILVTFQMGDRPKLTFSRKDMYDSAEPAHQFFEKGGFWMATCIWDLIAFLLICIDEELFGNLTMPFEIIVESEHFEAIESGKKLTELSNRVCLQPRNLAPTFIYYLVFHWIAVATSLGSCRILLPWLLPWVPDMATRPSQ